MYFYLWMKRLFLVIFLIYSYQGSFGQENRIRKVNSNAAAFIKNNKGEKGLVIFFLEPECPMCQKYTYTINAITKKKPETHKLNFIGIFSGKDINETSVSNYIERYKIQFPVFIDTNFVVADYLAATVTPEVFLLDKNDTVFYHGMIDNWYYSLGRRRNKPTEHYLEDNIHSLLNKQSAKYPSNEALGCIIYKSDK